jgi:hypothetical protein
VGEESSVVTHALHHIFAVLQLRRRLVPHVNL